jgi:hypothetical protein
LSDGGDLSSRRLVLCPLSPSMVDLYPLAYLSQPWSLFSDHGGGSGLNDGTRWFSTGMGCWMVYEQRWVGW